MAAVKTDTYKAIRAALIAASAVTDLLGAASAVYRTWPPKEAVWPCITMGIGDSPDASASSLCVQDYSAVLTIWGTDPDVNDDIGDALDATLYNKPQTDNGWSTDSLNILVCRRTGSDPPVATDYADDDQNRIEQVRTTWRVRITPK